MMQKPEHVPEHVVGQSPGRHEFTKSESRQCVTQGQEPLKSNVVPADIPLPPSPPESSFANFSKPSLVSLRSQDVTSKFTDGFATANTSSTAFDSCLLGVHPPQDLLLIDPRKSRKFDEASTISPHMHAKDHGADTGLKRKRHRKVNFNKPLKFWLIFVALCFSCLLSALDLVSGIGAGNLIRRAFGLNVWNRRPCLQPFPRSSRIWEAETISGWDRLTRSRLQPSCPFVVRWRTFWAVGTALVSDVAARS